jgi:hypothetical protein
MSRQGLFTTLLLSGLLMLPACSSSNPASKGAARVSSVVHLGAYTQVFASALPANPARAAVVEGFREGQVLWDKSENARRLVPAVRHYVTGQAFTHLVSAVKAEKARDLVPAGVDRFFPTRVTALAGRTATVATCEDGSQFKEQNPRTGQVDTSFLPSPGQAYLFETWRMAQLSGRWAITGLSVATLPSRSAEPCQPGMAGSTPPRRPNVAVLLRHMSTALQAARSVHITGTIRQGAKTLGVNLGITRSGELSGQVSENGAVLTVLATHGHSYIKLSEAFLRVAHLPTSACSQFCGKYVELPALQSHELLTGLNMASMTHSMTSTPASKVKYLGAVNFAGQPAWLLQDSQRNSIYVASHGTPYVLGGVAAPPAKGSLTLTQWNAVRIPGPPPLGQVVQLRQLMG